MSLMPMIYPQIKKAMLDHELQRNSQLYFDLYLKIAVNSQIFGYV